MYYILVYLASVAIRHQYRRKVKSIAKYTVFDHNYKDIFSVFRHQCRGIVQIGPAGSRQKTTIFQLVYNRYVVKARDPSILSKDRENKL